MREVILGSTNIRSPQNAFGVLPIQRTDYPEAIRILQRAYEGGMTFFDTARGYTNSEEKIGMAFGQMWPEMREKVAIATKTMGRTPELFWAHLEESLRLLKTDYVDIYQFHNVDQVYAPGDGSGMYEAMLEAKAQGKIHHIGVTTHKLEVAFDLVNSGLYETLQYPFSYLAAEREKELVELCKEKKVGFIAMKGLAGGLITNSAAAMAFMAEYDNVLPIWGIQHMHELEEWLAFMEKAPEMTKEMQAFIQKEQAELMGEFCRGCGYCMPCPQNIMINQAARISLMLRRAPQADWLAPPMQAEMENTRNCTECGQCRKRCPYGLDIPRLLKKNYEDYQTFL